MTPNNSPVRVDTRLVLRIYAAFAMTGGALMAAWGAMLLAPDPGESPWFRASLVRVLGASVFASGCSALALAGVEDPESRRRGIGWFAVGHGALALVVAIQVDAIPAWNSTLGLIAGTAATAAAIFFAHAWQYGENHDGRTGSFLTLLGGDAASATQRLRSEYERRIEAAAAQEERHRLARDLHDSVKQQLFAIHTAAATAQERFEGDAGGARAAIDQIRASAREAMAEMDAMLQGLRAAPLENTGLVEALKQACEALAFRTGAAVDFVPGSLPPNESLLPGAHDAIFRVAQEAFSNIARHARATRVRVEIDRAGHGLRLAIEDNGAGFDQSQPRHGSGLANMASRAVEFGGQLEVRSRPGEGTCIGLFIGSSEADPGDAQYHLHRAIGFGILLALFAAFTVEFCDSQMLILNVPIALIVLLQTVQEYLAFRRLREQRGPAR
jgi:signal transduction histidine kinase